MSLMPDNPAIYDSIRQKSRYVEQYV